MPTRLCYRSYAKINLYLDVLQRRGDGFHDLETLFQSVSLYDTLTFKARHEGITLEGAPPELGPAASNLIVRAAHLLQKHTGTKQGAAISLEKRIPAAAGLAGGSGNAAATLAALNRLWELNLPDGDLHALGLELGSDVPFCLLGGFAAATGRGERLTPLPAAPPLQWFVLLHPAVAVSTPAVFNDPRLTKNAAAVIDGMTPAFAGLVNALARGEDATAPPADTARAPLFYNAMEAVTFAMHPDLARWKAWLLEAGCAAAMMSGSGPTLIGVCRDRAQAEAIAAAVDGVRASVVQAVPASLKDCTHGENPA